jgi:hypothetical protein
MPEYSHQQRAWISIILYAFAITIFPLAVLMGDLAGTVFVGVVAAFLLVLATAMHYLQVEDDRERLTIAFGPLPLFRTFVNYADIQEVRVAQIPLLCGAGIHYMLGFGWVWKIGGRDGVVLKLKKRTITIGTDEAEKLASFLDKRRAAA